MVFLYGKGAKVDIRGYLATDHKLYWHCSIVEAKAGWTSWIQTALGIVSRCNSSHMTPM